MAKMKLVVALVPIVALLSCGDSSSGSDCDPNWMDPNGQVMCEEGFPVSCDQAENCFETVAECERSGQCSN